MSNRLKPPALDPATVPSRAGSSYPTAALRAAVEGRVKQALGDALGLRNFGVNLVRLEPGAHSSLRHWHERQDEFVYVLAGELTLVTERGRQTMRAGDCAGFPAGEADGHHLCNETTQPALYLEVGDRLPGDHCHYPDVDLEARALPTGYEYYRKTGERYERAE